MTAGQWAEVFEAGARAAAGSNPGAVMGHVLWAMSRKAKEIAGREAS